MQNNNNIPPGIYFVRIQFENKSISYTKVIVANDH
ncbi:MAG: T9SS type A sorting domain-containing protein [Bacteroidetes bacterium]|nr:T9SS type A sorting domain-containing protein [Bacteroidota bacterium]